MKTLLAWTISEPEKRYLEENLDNFIYVETTDVNDLSGDDLNGVEALICGIGSREIISKCSSLKFVQSMISGTSHIDLASAEDLGIPVASAKGGNAISVGEHAMMLMLNLVKNYNTHKKNVEKGDWSKIYSQSLNDMTLGIIGYGNLGRRVAELGKYFGMNVIANRKRPELGTGGVKIDFLGDENSLYYIMNESDMVLLSLPKTRETTNLISGQCFEAMKPGSYLVNICRGTVMDYDACFNALTHGKISGFATDVFPEEPADFSHPIFKLDNVVATPHVAAYNTKAKIRCLDVVIENIINFESGRKINNQVDYRLGY